MVAKHSEPEECGFVFDPLRKWKFDFAWPSALVAVEIEGGTGGRRGKFAGQNLSRHTSGAGYRGDCEKYNAAQCLGWIVLRYTSADLDERPVIVVTQVQAALALRWRKTK